MKLLSTLIFTAFVFATQAQTLEVEPGKFHYENSYYRSHSNTLSQQCLDTLRLPQARGTTFRGITVAPTSATALGQWYDIAQPITISGFEFFAWQTDPSNSNPKMMLAKLYKSGAGGLPIGSAIAVDTIMVNKVASPTLNATRRHAIFQFPITLNEPYVLAVESADNIAAAVITNDWDVNDGNGENLGVGAFGSTWYKAMSINVGGVPFDADVLVQPFVSYDLEVGFTMDKHCIEDFDTLRITNLSSPIFENRFYNTAAYNSTTGEGTESYNWSLNSDSSQKVFEPEYVLGTKGKYVVTLIDTLFGWTRNCAVMVKDSADQQPVADFTIGGLFDVKDFFNSSTGADKITWYFPAGEWTHLESPRYVFTAAGQYDITLVVENACGSDTMEQTVTVFGTGIEERAKQLFSFYPNPVASTVHFQLKTEAMPERVLVYSTDGKVVLNQPFENQLEVSFLAPGLYFVELVADGEKFRQKLLISR